MAAEALLKPGPLVAQPPEPEEDRYGGEGGSHWPVKMVAFMLLAFSSAIALGAVSSFLIFSFLDLVLLFHCLRQYARTPPASPGREILKVAAWLLATMLVLTLFQLLELWFLTMGK